MENLETLSNEELKSIYAGAVLPPEYIAKHLPQVFIKF